MLFTLITGASSGIGLELAKQFAQNGKSLILVARSEKALQDLAQELTHQYQIKVHVIPADLSRPEECQRLFELCRQQNLHVENLVNNAGVGDNAAFVETEWTRQEQMIRLNMESLTRLTHLFLPEMVQRKSGGILNVASTAAFQPGPYMAVYYATKAYVLSFSEAINAELKGSGVHATALCPGPTHSAFQATAKMDKSKLFKMLNVPSSKDVAEFAYQSFQKKKAVAVHGVMNKIMSLSVGVTPRFLLLKIVSFLNK
ncbi:SDR family NAD(P)-dependent oxidoreductase [Bdellovibrio sp. HCB2-146]|uniref:SDR family NAD(P)-dependent oxidoreductase n=1 Tax=Bdellovibrio sp. HCB2-146 TaxID=3394362 RepID=UPI0039BD10BC